MNIYKRYVFDINHLLTSKKIVFDENWCLWDLTVARRSSMRAVIFKFLSDEFFSTRHIFQLASKFVRHSSLMAAFIFAFL